jgi:hypothetical protein
MQTKLPYVTESGKIHNYRCENLKSYKMGKIWGFHVGDYEEWRLLGCYAM